MSQQTQNLPLLQAAAKGDINALQQQIDSADDINMTDEYGHTALISAILANNEDCVTLLLKSGADFEKPCEFTKWTPVHNTAVTGNVRILNQLIEAGANIHAIDKDGASALSLAALNGSTDCLRLLIDAGIDVNTPDENALTSPLMHAIAIGNVRCVELLIEADADIYHEDISGRSAFTESSRINGKTIQALIDDRHEVLEKERIEREAREKVERHHHKHRCIRRYTKRGPC